MWELSNFTFNSEQGVSFSIPLHLCLNDNTVAMGTRLYRLRIFTEALTISIIWTPFRAMMMQFELISLLARPVVTLNVAQRNLQNTSVDKWKATYSGRALLILIFVIFLCAYVCQNACEIMSLVWHIGYFTGQHFKFWFISVLFWRFWHIKIHPLVATCYRRNTPRLYFLKFFNLCYLQKTFVFKVHKQINVP